MIARNVGVWSSSRRRSGGAVAAAAGSAAGETSGKGTKRGKTGRENKTAGPPLCGANSIFDLRRCGITATPGRRLTVRGKGWRGDVGGTGVGGARRAFPVGAGNAGFFPVYYYRQFSVRRDGSFRQRRRKKFQTSPVGRRTGFRLGTKKKRTGYQPPSPPGTAHSTTVSIGAIPPPSPPPRPQPRDGGARPTITRVHIRLVRTRRGGSIDFSRFNIYSIFRFFFFFSLLRHSVPV